MSAPAVSVVMGVFNGASSLDAAAASILAQEGVALELIVVDDGSTDETPAILARLAAADARVRVLRQEKAGLTLALIRGCAAAAGRYIARQDADDVSLPDRLAAQAALLDGDASLSFVSCWAEMIGPRGETLQIQERPADPEAATRLLLESRVGPPGHGSVMLRRSSYEQVGGYRPAFYYAQDSDLWLRLGAVGRVAYVPRVLYRYGISENSLSGRLHAAKLPYARLVDACYAARRAGRDDAPLLAQFKAPPPAARAADSRADTLYFIGRCLAARRDRRAIGYLLRSLRLRPLQPRAWAGVLAALPLLPEAAPVKRETRG